LAYGSSMINNTALIVAKMGYLVLAQQSEILTYAHAASDTARAVLAQDKEPWSCGGTWFVGVDSLSNGMMGEIGGVSFPFASLGLAPQVLHKGQLSVLRAGYPRRSAEETGAAFAFRRDRDAAHIDGILPIGPERRRMIKEPHAWILGIALNDCTPNAAPLVVWQGSHQIMAKALSEALLPFAPHEWDQVDITAPYQQARRAILATCPRIELPLKFGQASLLHRLTLHGVAPWHAEAVAPPEGRMIGYFRPHMPDITQWIRAD
jgi:hypothetical protein